MIEGFLVLRDMPRCLCVQTAGHKKCASEDASVHSETVRGEGKKHAQEEARLVFSQEHSTSQYLRKTMLEIVTNEFNLYRSDLPVSPWEPRVCSKSQHRKYLGILRTENKS